MNSLDEIKTEIAKPQYHYISFDIFDTLIVRSLWEPSDLFILLDDYYRSLCSSTVGKRFSIMRMVAEGESRHAASVSFPPKEDTTLDEIYSYMGEKYKIKQEIIEIMMEYEMNLELKHCRARQSIKNLYNYAIEMGKEVICISDMYLPRQGIERILKENGYDGFERVFVSSEVRLTKHTGSLYSYALDKLGVSSERVLHIGDNLLVDKINAEKAGLRAVHYPKTKEVFTDALADKAVNKGLSSKFIKVSCDALPIRNLFNIRSKLAILSNEYFDNPFIDPRIAFDEHFISAYKQITDGYKLSAMQVWFIFTVQKSKYFSHKLISFSRRKFKVLYDNKTKKIQ